MSPAAPAAGPPSAPAPLPHLRKPDGQAWLALLADDNAINREVGVALLQALGLQVHTANDGQEAVDKAALGAYDLVLMDLRMPRLDGLSATRLLRAMPQLAGLPIIAMTANPKAHSLEACLAAGMDDFVAKPIDLLHLAQVLSRHLGQG